MKQILLADTFKKFEGGEWMRTSTFASSYNFHMLDKIKTEIFFSQYLPPYVTHNSSLTNFQKTSISYTIRPETIAVDIEHYLKDAVCHQIITHLYKTIFIKKYYSTETDIFISILDDDNSVLKKISPILNTHKYFVSCIEIANLLIRNHPQYTHSIEQTEFDRVNDLIGYVGTINNTKIMTNHLQSLENSNRFRSVKSNLTNKYPNNLISLFDGIELNLEILEVKKIQDASLSSYPWQRGKWIVDFKFDYLIRNPKYYFLIENENSSFYSEFLSFQRESKITKILN